MVEKGQSYMQRKSKYEMIEMEAANSIVAIKSRET